MKDNANNLTTQLNKGCSLASQTACVSVVCLEKPAFYFAGFFYFFSVWYCYMRWHVRPIG